MSLGTLKSRHQTAIKLSPLARKLAERRKLLSLGKVERLSPTPHLIAPIAQSKNKDRSSIAIKLPGIKRGSLVVISYKVDPAYGGRTETFKGKVRNFDGYWINAVNNDGVIFNWPASMVKVKKAA